MLNYSVVKKYVFISTITMLFIFLGSGVQSVLAGNDIGAMMKNWFAKEQSQSVEEVYSAISAEKDLLLAELQQTIDEEKQRAIQELEQFKQQEIANRISSLRSYAANLAEGITIDTSAEKASIIAELDAIFANAMSQMSGTSSTTRPPLTGENPEKEGNVVEGDEASDENNGDEDASGEVEDIDGDFIDETKPDSGANNDFDLEQIEQEESVDSDFPVKDDSSSDDLKDKYEGQVVPVIIVEPDN